MKVNNKYIGYIEAVRNVDFRGVKLPTKSLWNCKWNRITNIYRLDNVFTPGPGPFKVSQDEMRELWDNGDIKTIKNKEYNKSK